MTGGGAVRRHATQIFEYFHCLWCSETAGHLGAEPGLPKWQTYWDFLTLVWALVVWGSKFVTHRVAVLGDNTGALTDALNLKGTGPLLAIARELAWRQAKHGWLFAVGHVPSESNGIPDALSRLAEPGKSFPARALRHAQQVAAPASDGFWRVR